MVVGLERSDDTWSSASGEALLPRQILSYWSGLRGGATQRTPTGFPFGFLTWLSHGLSTEPPLALDVPG